MTRNLLLFGLLFLTNGLFSQVSSDTVDQYNDNHKRTGLWTVYLDEYLNQVDQEKAVFFAYELYDDGFCVFPFAGYSKKKYATEFTGQMGTPGNPVLLTGDHTLIYRKTGKAGYESSYKNGRPLMLKAYRYDKQGVRCMTEILDFENKYNGIDGTFYYQIFHYDFVREKGYYRKGGKKWYVH